MGNVFGLVGIGIIRVIGLILLGGAFYIRHQYTVKMRNFLKEQYEAECREKESRPRTIVDPFPPDSNGRICGDCMHYKDEIYEGKHYCHCGKLFRYCTSHHGYRFPAFFLKWPNDPSCKDYQENAKEAG